MILIHSFTELLLTEDSYDNNDNISGLSLREQELELRETRNFLVHCS